MFLGRTFAGSLIETTPIPYDNETVIKVHGGIFDELYGSSKLSEYSTDIPNEWDLDTLIHANFDGTLLAGNVKFAVSEVSKLRLKRREKGSIKWTTLYEQPVINRNDLNVEWYDRTARANTVYEYTIVPIFGEVEGAFYCSEIATDFQGLFIMDRDDVFATELDVVIKQRRNKPRSIITTINRKYPIVISNGANDYDSGTVSAQFLEYDSVKDSWDIKGGRRFVKSLKDFLNNGSAKLLKYQDGRMWLIDISSNTIEDTEDERGLQVHTSFDYTEIGDCDNPVDLHDCGIIDLDTRCYR